MSEIIFPEETTYFVAFNTVDDWTGSFVTSSQEMESAKEYLLHDVDPNVVVANANAVGVPVTLVDLTGDVPDE